MCKEIINNRVFIDNEPTNLYVCDLCGDMVTTLRSHTTLDDKDVQAATIVLTLNTLFKKSLMNTIYKAIAMRLSNTYT